MWMAATCTSTARWRMADKGRHLLKALPTKPASSVAGPAPECVHAPGAEPFLPLRSHQMLLETPAPCKMKIVMEDVRENVVNCNLVIGFIGAGLISGWLFLCPRITLSGSRVSGSFAPRFLVASLSSQRRSSGIAHRFPPAVLDADQWNRDARRGSFTF